MIKPMLALATVHVDSATVFAVRLEFSLGITNTKRRKTMLQEIRNRMASVGLGLALALSVCSAARAQDVRSNSMPGIDFAKYRTYKYVPIEGATQPNQIVDAQIKMSVDAQLKAKGLTRTDADTADLYIGYQVSINQQTQWNAYGSGGVRWGGGMATATSTTISIGTLALDMYDPATKQLVWTGSATKTIDPGNNQQQQQKNLDKAMEKLLKPFPPKQK